MGGVQSADSARKVGLVDAAYEYATRHGLVEVSLPPLAEAIGSSPRVLLFLLGSKDELIQALLVRARVDELAMLDDLAHGLHRAHRSRAASAVGPDEPARTARQAWEWLAAPAHRGLLTPLGGRYARSLVDPPGPWSSFARRPVDDWLDVLATDDSARTTVAVRAYFTCPVRRTGGRPDTVHDRRLLQFTAHDGRGELTLGRRSCGGSRWRYRPSREQGGIVGDVGSHPEDYAVHPVTRHRARACLAI